VFPVESRPLARIRQLLLALLALGIAGTGAELMLIGHYGDTTQAIPLFLLSTAALTTAWVAAKPGVLALRTFQFAMLLAIGGGLIGITVHAQVAAEIARGVRAAGPVPPALSPGVLVQLGMLGLLYTYAHPRLGSGNVDD
jgi:hypothetical protein